MAITLFVQAFIMLVVLSTNMAQPDVARAVASLVRQRRYGGLDVSSSLVPPQSPFM